MVILISLMACDSSSSFDSLFFSGGEWAIANSSNYEIESTGIIVQYTYDRRHYYHCIYDCVGRLSVPYGQMEIEARNSTIAISGFSNLTVRALNSSLVIKDSDTLFSNTVSSDVWLEAFPNADITISSFGGDVDVNVPNQNWSTELVGDKIINQIDTEVLNGGVIRVFSRNGTISIVEVFSIGKVTVR